ncbi:Os03g0650200 [Oryza sativa Japonica Group]|uniref:Os03g0650200 protein n=1 Tax=Oryza sativa subsp. japonica TaxID=39947 RepID=A0A0P0W1B4_ORYSJ|nr:hypothetical protein EE612_019296 [Oryza sativa]BAS85508.1 Os03g0650200 [Oryza sativa Japonica Group]
MELAPALSLSMAMSSWVATIVTLLIGVAVASLRGRQRRTKARLNLPPGPRGWPVFGSLGALAGALPPHRALAALAARHGPLMHLRLGSFDAVVASSAGAARLVLKTHDAAFADRARTAAGELVAYNYKGIVHTPYGAYWRMARKLCATELFSPRRVDSYERIRAEEIGALARDLFGRAGRAVAVRERLASATLRNILRMSVGDKWSGVYGSADGEAFRRTLDEAFEVSGAVSNVGEWVSLLGWLDVQGFRRRMKRLSKMYDRFLEQILHEHEASMAAAGGGGQRGRGRGLGGEADARRREGVHPGHHRRRHGEQRGGDGVGDGGAPPPPRRHGRRHRRARPRGRDGAVGDGARHPRPPLRRRRREGGAAAAPGGPAASPAPRHGGHGGRRRLRRPRRRARAGERVGHRARPGVVARPPRCVPARALPPRRRRRRRRIGRARAALRAAAVRVGAAGLPGDEPGDEDGGAGRGELGAGVRVAAAGRRGGGGREHGGAGRAVHAPEGAARRRRRAQAAGASLRRHRRMSVAVGERASERKLRISGSNASEGNSITRVVHVCATSDILIDFCHLTCGCERMHQWVSVYDICT